jgi:Zn-dependent protease
MMERGYLSVGRLFGVPLRLHWTLPLGALLLSGGRLAPGLWVGVLVILLAHEAGHALLVRRVGLTNLGIDLTGIGGRCRFAGHATPRQRSIVAWGGVLVQLAILVPALAVSLFVDVPPGFAADLLHALTRANAILLAVNLLPVEPLDGAEAWRLFRHLRARRRKETLREALAEADRRRDHRA